MLSPDADARRMLVRERHSELSRDAFRADAPEPLVAETEVRRRRRRLHLRRLRLHLRPARSAR